MTHFSKQMRTQWHDGQEVDIYSAMGKLALDIVAKTLFNSDVSDEAERVAHILDTVLSIMNVLHDGLADSKYRPCPLLVKYVEAGWLGKKSGRGFYDYRGETPVPTR